MHHIGGKQMKQMLTKISLVTVVGFTVLLSLALGGCEWSPESNDLRIVKRDDGYVLQSYIDFPVWKDLCRSEPRSLEQIASLKLLLEPDEEVVIR
jgi:hypothetical protein